MWRGWGQGARKWPPCRGGAFRVVPEPSPPLAQSQVAKKMPPGHDWNQGANAGGEFEALELCSPARWSSRKSLLHCFLLLFGEISLGFRLYFVDFSA